MSTIYKVGFCVSGQGSLFRSALEHREKLGILPSLLVLEEKAAKDLEALAHQHQVPVFRFSPSPRNEFDLKLTQVCLKANLDLLCTTFDRILPRELVQHYVGKIINVHPA